MSDVQFLFLFKVDYNVKYFGDAFKDRYTHKWNFSLFPLNNCVLDYVKFILHESFKNNIRKITKPPFTVKESGYGTFDMKINMNLFGKTFSETYEVKLFISPPENHTEDYFVISYKTDQKNFAYFLRNGGIPVPDSISVSELKRELCEMGPDILPQNKYEALYNFVKYGNASVAPRLLNGPAPNEPPKREKVKNHISLDSNAIPFLGDTKPPHSHKTNRHKDKIAGQKVIKNNTDRDSGGNRSRSSINSQQPDGPHQQRKTKESHGLSKKGNFEEYNSDGSDASSDFQHNSPEKPTNIRKLTNNIFGDSEDEPEPTNRKKIDKRNTQIGQMERIRKRNFENVDRDSDHRNNTPKRAKITDTKAQKNEGIGTNFQEEVSNKRRPDRESVAPCVTKKSYSTDLYKPLGKEDRPKHKQKQSPVCSDSEYEEIFDKREKNPNRKLISGDSPCSPTDRKHYSTEKLPAHKEKACLENDVSVNKRLIHTDKSDRNPPNSSQPTDTSGLSDRISAISKKKVSTKYDSILKKSNKIKEPISESREIKEKMEKRECNDISNQGKWVESSDKRSAIPESRPSIQSNLKESPSKNLTNKTIFSMKIKKKSNVDERIDPAARQTNTSSAEDSHREREKEIRKSQNPVGKIKPPNLESNKRTDETTQNSNSTRKSNFKLEPDTRAENSSKFEFSQSTMKPVSPTVSKLPEATSHTQQPNKAPVKITMAKPNILSNTALVDRAIFDDIGHIKPKDPVSIPHKPSQPVIHKKADDSSHHRRRSRSRSGGRGGHRQSHREDYRSHKRRDRDSEESKQPSSYREHRELRKQESHPAGGGEKPRTIDIKTEPIPGLDNRMVKKPLDPVPTVNDVKADIAEQVGGGDDDEMDISSEEDALSCDKDGPDQSTQDVIKLKAIVHKKAQFMSDSADEPNLARTDALKPVDSTVAITADHKPNPVLSQSAATTASPITVSSSSSRKQYGDILDSPVFIPYEWDHPLDTRTQTHSYSPAASLDDKSDNYSRLPPEPIGVNGQTGDDGGRPEQDSPAVKLNHRERLRLREEIANIEDEIFYKSLHNLVYAAFCDRECGLNLNNESIRFDMSRISDSLALNLRNLVDDFYIKRENF